jgi:hypothetical protein
VLGDVVAIELSIRGTFLGPFAATRALAPRTKTFEQWLVTRPDL